MESSLIHPPKLSGNNQQKYSYGRETWREITVNFAYEVSLFIAVRFFNMP
jgi:hypothetical protein